MTTGAPIYLVSACASGEEFVAAFRRYADRNGVVFVPIADPLPSGKKGRFALTLKDGGVMVEGDAEVVSSAKTPSMLYGRVGMTLKFLVPDEPSKTMLTELEKARVALKPQPPSIAPRPADVPAEPRSKPPVPSGRIDAVNALAECVAIGAGLSPPGETGEVPPKNANQKFVVPSVPSIPPGRPRTPSTPGGTPTVKPGGTMPPPFKPPTTPTTMGVAPLAKPVATPTTLGVAPLAKPPEPATQSPVRMAVAAASDKADLVQTMRGPAPGVDLTRPAKEDLSTTVRGTKPAGMPGAPRNPPPASTPPPIPQRQPTPAAALPVVKPQRMTTPFAPMPVVQQPARPAPPMQQPAPPVVAPAAKRAPEVEVSEPTDLTAIPQVEDELPDGVADSTIPIAVPHEAGSAPVMIVAEKPKDDRPERTIREPRRTTIGVAVVPSGVMVLPAAPALRTPSEDEVRDTGVMDVPSATAQSTAPMTARGDAIDDVDALSATLPPQEPLRPSVVRATVEEPTPSGDWTMSTGADGPTITPTPREKLPIKKGPLTGNWVIALDPSQPDGWSEPSKVAKPPVAEPPGPPVSAVSSEKPLDSNRRLATEPSWAPEPTVQVDPTLVGPLKPMPKLDEDVEDEDEDDPALPPPPSVQRPIVGEDGLMAAQSTMPGMAPSGSDAMSVPMRGPMPGSYVTPPAGQPHLASASGANPALSFTPERVVTDAGSGFFRDSGDLASYASGPAPAIDDARRRKRMIVILASAAAFVVLGVILLLALGSGGGKPDTSGTADAAGKPDTVDKHSIAVTSVDAGAETPRAIDAATVSVAPPSDAAKAMVAPPSDAAKVVVAPPVDAAVASETPTDCKVAVSSVPGGAEIVIGKDVVGATPASLTLPCGLEAKLVVRKARFVSQTRLVTPKATGGKPVKVILTKVTFSVKVSSTPSGASITVGTKAMGFTPNMVKLPAFELSTLKLAKDGFAPDIQKITPKQNNQTVHSTLKKQPGAKKR